MSSSCNNAINGNFVSHHARERMPSYSIRQTVSAVCSSFFSLNFWPHGWVSKKNTMIDDGDTAHNFSSQYDRKEPISPYKTERHQNDPN